MTTTGSSIIYLSLPAPKLQIHKKNKNKTRIRGRCRKTPQKRVALYYKKLNDEVMDEFEEELRINPNGFGAYNGLKVTLFDK